MLLRLVRYLPDPFILEQIGQRGHTSSELGISLKWTTEIANSTYVNMSRFEEGLGRTVFVAGALEYEKPFLGPLYRFLSLHPRGSIQRVPSYVSFILSYLANQIAKCRHFPCASTITSVDIAASVDAQANSDRTGIGGWLPARGADGKIMESEFPWVFERGGKPSLVISSLESLAVVIELEVFFPGGSSHSRKRLSIIPTWTDNRGNGSALNKLMSTRFRPSALLMELATHMKHEGIKASVQWAPRESNREADRLANGDFTGFSLEFRIHIDVASISWYTLDDALVMGREAEHSYECAKKSGALPGTTRREKRKRQDERLKVADLW